MRVDVIVQVHPLLAFTAERQELGDRLAWKERVRLCNLQISTTTSIYIRKRNEKHGMKELAMYRLVGALLAGMLGSLALLVNMNAADDAEELVNNRNATKFHSRLSRTTHVRPLQRTHLLLVTGT